MRHTWHMFSKTWILLIRGQNDFIVKCGPCYFQIPWLKLWLQNAIRPSRWCVEITLDIFPWLAGADLFEYALGFCGDPFLPGFPEPRSDLSSCRTFVLPFLWRTKVLPVARILIWPEPDLGSSMPGFFYRPVRFSADHLTNSACSWVFNKLVKAAMSIFWLRPTSHVAVDSLKSISLCRVCL